MNKKLLIRIIIAVVAWVAALVVLGFSSGLFYYWAKGINHYIDGGYDNNVSVFVAEGDITVSKGAPTQTALGRIEVLFVESDGDGTKVTFALISELGLNGAKVLSFAPLSGNKPFIATIAFSDGALTFISQTVEKNRVIAEYYYPSDLSGDAVFSVTDIVVNDFSR